MITSGSSVRHVHDTSTTCSRRVHRSDEEAVARANDSEYGLGGSVWTSDFATGNALASKLLAGTVWVNQHTDLTEAPFGGFKQSGLGREFGSFNVASFTEVQTLSLAKQDV